MIHLFSFSIYRLHHLPKRKQSNKHSFELESSESASLINARAASAAAAAGRASFFSPLLREEFITLRLSFLAALEELK